MLRHWRCAVILLGSLAAVKHLPLTLPAPTAHAQSADFVAPEECAACHRGIWETWRQTGMGRSFSRPTPANTVEDYAQHNTFYHRASDSYFTMFRRDSKYYQRRHQLGFDGKQVNILEKQIDYIMGSGNHARAYLHRTPANKLIELPLAWYAEKGGYWAMNPGYDRPNHDGFRRTLGYECMFCHNGYPQIPAGNNHPFAEPVYLGALPEGIDCQRCHGPGAKHVALAKAAGAKAQDIRDAVVNPSRLSPQSQMEVCLQCHLETTSFALPNSLLRAGRGPFSYRPGEPLSKFELFFDHAPGKARAGKFEIAHSAYRLRKSACFLQSKGQLTCTTCHNPHDIPRGLEAERHYTAVCLQCHANTLERLVAARQHPPSTTCTACHMPKRRTGDVVHAVVTDHYIQRRKPTGDLLAEIPERHETGTQAYRGEVLPYYPAALPPTPENQLDLALAQVIEKSNLSAGIGRLTAAIARHSPQQPEYYLELAEALRENGQLAKALPFYRETVQRSPKFAAGLQKLGTALRRSGKYSEAVETLQRATAEAPEIATTWHELGLAYRAQGKTAEAIAALEKAISLDRDLYEAFNNLGVIYFAEHDSARAESAFRQAIRIQPGYADAHGNLGNLLSKADDLPQARQHFEIALRSRPDDAPTRFNYATLLGRMRQFDAAQRELEACLRTDPAFADAHELLANLLMARGQAPTALPHYRKVLQLQPQSGKAHLALGMALVAVRDAAGAISHLQKAAAAADPEVRQAAIQALRQLRNQQNPGR